MKDSYKLIICNRKVILVDKILYLIMTFANFDHGYGYGHLVTEVFGDTNLKKAFKTSNTIGNKLK